MGIGKISITVCSSNPLTLIIYLQLPKTYVINIVYTIL